MLRCSAACLDYMIFVAVPVMWLISTKLFTDIGASAPGAFVWFIGVLVFAVNFILFPLLRGQTIGKMLAGITIVNIDGTDLRLVGVVRRNAIGYILTAVTLGLGFMLSALNPSGRALHDLVGGTVVVCGHKKLV